MLNCVSELSGWQIFAYTYVSICIIANVIFTFVISVGGIFDLIHLFKELGKNNNDNKNSDKFCIS